MVQRVLPRILAAIVALIAAVLVFLRARPSQDDVSLQILGAPESPHIEAEPAELASAEPPVAAIVSAATAEERWQEWWRMLHRENSQPYTVQPTAGWDCDFVSPAWSTDRALIT